jgi:hypothetical protein
VLQHVDYVLDVVSTLDRHVIEVNSLHRMQDALAVQNTLLRLLPLVLVLVLVAVHR